MPKRDDRPWLVSTAQYQLRNGDSEEKVREWLAMMLTPSRNVIALARLASGEVIGSILREAKQRNVQESGRKNPLTMQEMTDYFHLLTLYRGRKQFLGLKGKYRFDTESRNRLLNLIRKRSDYLLDGSYEKIMDEEIRKKLE